MEKKYTLLDPKVDYIFKQIFGQDTPVCNRLLLSLLNSIFERKGSRKIKSIEYVNPYLDKEYEIDKQSILDIRVKTDKDESIDIEMQVASSPYYVKRSLWYWASMYEKQLERGEDYGELNKCIVVNLLNFNMSILNGVEDYHNTFELKERFSNVKLTDDLEIHYVELKKFKDIKNIKNLDTLSKWTLFFNDASEEGKEEIIEELRKEMEEIDMAAEILQRVSQDEHERAKYESRRKWIIERNTILNEAERIRKKADEASKRADEEAKRAEEEAKRAEEEAKRAERAEILLQEQTNKAEETIKNSVLALLAIMNEENIAKTLNIDIKKVQDIVKMGI